MTFVFPIGSVFPGGLRVTSSYVYRNRLDLNLDVSDDPTLLDGASNGTNGEGSGEHK
jgi:hypothetical protein